MANTINYKETKNKHENRMSDFFQQKLEWSVYLV